MKNDNINYILQYLKRNYPAVLAKQRKIRIKKIIKVLLIDSLLIFAGFLCKSAFDERGFGTALIVSFAVLCIIVPLWLKPRFILFAPIKHGKIVKLNIMIVGGAKDIKLMINHVEATQSHTVLNIIAETEKGKVLELILPSHFSQAMRVGDEIVKLPAIEYPIIVSRGHSKRICPICGNIAPASETVCIGCGNDFIKFD